MFLALCLNNCGVIVESTQEPIIFRGKLRFISGKKISGLEDEQAIVVAIRLFRSERSLNDRIRD